MYSWVKMPGENWLQDNILWIYFWFLLRGLCLLVTEEEKKIRISICNLEGKGKFGIDVDSACWPSLCLVQILKVLSSFLTKLLSVELENTAKYMHQIITYCAESKKKKWL